MSNRPEKCRWCGLHEVDDGTLDTVFACGSSWRCRDMWFQSTGCEEIVALRKRVAKAIEAARLQARWPSGEFVEIVEAKALDLIVEILEGKQ